MQAVDGGLAGGPFSPDGTFVVVGPNACVSAGNGAWSAASTWTACDGAAPTSADAVVVLGGHSVTLDTDAAVTGLRIDPSGTLGYDGTGRSLAVSGDVHVAAGGPSRRRRRPPVSTCWRSAGISSP